MAKSKPAATAADDDIKPADGFAPAADLGGDIEPQGGPEDAPGVDPRDVEIAALKAENARLKAAGAPPHAGGGKFRVALRDGPAAVVQCEPGEHPFEAYRRATGVINSQHAPEIHARPDDARCGVCGIDGEVPAPRGD
jgi:hypothetical protein